MSEQPYTPIVDLDIMVQAVQSMRPADAKTTLHAALTNAFYSGKLAGMKRSDELHAEYPITAPCWWKLWRRDERV